MVSNIRLNFFGVNVRHHLHLPFSFPDNRIFFHGKDAIQVSIHRLASSAHSMNEKLLSVPPRIYKRPVCNSPSGADLHLERGSIPMIGPKFPPLTSKIVEHSCYLPREASHRRQSRRSRTPRL